jgi:hypothetical protein
MYTDALSSIKKQNINIQEDNSGRRRYLKACPSGQLQVNGFVGEATTPLTPDSTISTLGNRLGMSMRDIQISIEHVLN